LGSNEYGMLTSCIDHDPLRCCRLRKDHCGWWQASPRPTEPLGSC
jgi:hypothetical protein